MTLLPTKYETELSEDQCILIEIKDTFNLHAELLREESDESIRVYDGGSGAAQLRRSQRRKETDIIQRHRNDSRSTANNATYLTNATVGKVCSFTIKGPYSHTK